MKIWILDDTIKPVARIASYDCILFVIGQSIAKMQDSEMADAEGGDVQSQAQILREEELDEK